MTCLTCHFASLYQGQKITQHLRRNPVPGPDLVFASESTQQFIHDPVDRLFTVPDPASRDCRSASDYPFEISDAGSFDIVHRQQHLGIGERNTVGFGKTLANIIR